MYLEQGTYDILNQIYDLYIKTYIRSVLSIYKYMQYIYNYIYMHHIGMQAGNSHFQTSHFVN